MHDNRPGTGEGTLQTPQSWLEIAAGRGPRRRGVALLAVALFGLIAAGCETGGRVAAPGQLIADYEAGRFRGVYERADQLVVRTGGRQRDEARYLAGMSAYHLGWNARAMEHLSPLVDHSDRDLAGPAAATLGFIYADRGNDRRAAELMERAAGLLDSEDSARAHFHAGLLRQKLGQWINARAHLSLAISRSRDPALEAVARQRLASRGFSLQFGAFSKSDNARSAATRLASAARRAGLGSPHVLRSTMTGEASVLYLVQAGWFASYDAARSAEARLAVDDVLIVPVTRVR